jgi:uncharacterized membrane protein YraQ (UPF0718 family)
MHNVLQVLDIAWHDLLDLGFYFLLALFISAMVDLLCLDVLARRSFRRHGMLGILFTTALGALSPFCSFTVIPLIRGLLRGGVPLSAVMAFWIASPAMDPSIFALTARAIGVRLALARLLGALVLSVSAGTITLSMERRGLLSDVLRAQRTPARVAAPIEQPVAVGAASSSSIVTDLPVAGAAALAAGPACAKGSCQSSAEDPGEDDGAPWWPQAKASLQSGHGWRLAARNMARDNIALGKWLVFACVFEGIIAVYVPTHLVTSLLGGSGLTAIPMAVGISFPLYLNGIGSIPIVAGLLAKGMVPGAAVSFLLGGAVTTIPAMIAVCRVVSNKVFALYLLYGIIGSILLGFCAQLILAAYW